MKKYVAYFIILFVPMVSFGLPRFLTVPKPPVTITFRELLLKTINPEYTKWQIMLTSIGNSAIGSGPIITVQDATYPVTYSWKEWTGGNIGLGYGIFNFEGPLLHQTQAKMSEACLDLPDILAPGEQTNPLALEEMMSAEEINEITQEIMNKVRYAKHTYPSHAKDNFLVNIPEQVILKGGQIPTEGLDILRIFYRERLQLTIDNIKREGKVRLGDWMDALQVVVNLGFFGTAEDATAIAELMKIVPEDLRKITELVGVASLLNLNDPAAYKELHNLADMRAQTEHWFDSDAPEEGKKSLNAHLLAAQYIYSTNGTLGSVAYAVYPRAFARSELNPWIVRFLPGDEDFVRYASKPHQEENTVYYTSMLRKYGGSLMTYLLDRGNNPDDIRNFLYLKRIMPKPLVLGINAE